MMFSPLATRRTLLLGAMLLGASAAAPALAAPSQSQGDFTDIPYADWTDYEPLYRLYPGDEIEVSIPSAPELNKTTIVQPDGRVALPLVGPVMVADRTVVEAQGALGQAFSAQLLRPQVNIVVKAAPLKVFVGGEVGTPSVIEMNGDVDALRAIVQAGGFKATADLKRVIIVRRGPDGRGMMRRVNLSRGLRGGGDVDLVPLRRFDIVYVPRTGVAAAGLFVQQVFRDLPPAPIGFSYALDGYNRR